MQVDGWPGNLREDRIGHRTRDTQGNPHHVCRGGYGGGGQGGGRGGGGEGGGGVGQGCYWVFSYVAFRLELVGTDVSSVDHDQLTVVYLSER